jgi:hypothetical protein
MSRYSRTVFKLSEPQIEIVMTAAGGLPAEKRGLFVNAWQHGWSSMAPALLPPISMWRCAWRCGG